MAFVGNRIGIGFTVDLELVNHRALAVKDFEVDFSNEVLEMKTHLPVVGIRSNLEVEGS